jgi:hypothetical protein
MCGAKRDFRFVPIADIAARAGKLKDHLAAVSPKSNQVF